MADTIFCRARSTVISASGTYTLDYAIPTNTHLIIRELFASTSKSLVQIEVLYSEDNGSTWINPWDSGSDIILKLFLGAGVPATGKPDMAFFIGGTNRLLRLKITNLNPVDSATVTFLIKGLQRDV